MASPLSLALGAAAGTGPPVPAVQGNSRDDDMILLIGTGTATTTGTLVTVTLGSNLSSVVDGPALPRVSLSLLSAAAVAAQCVISSVTTRTVVIACNVAPTASLAATVAGVAVRLTIGP